MVATAEKKLLTADDVWNLGEDARVELIRGELREVAAAGGRHGEVGGQLAGYLSVYGQHGRVGRVYTSETGFVLEKSPTTLLVPGLAYIKVEHLPSGGAPDWFFETPPDALLETLSPSQRFGELVEKVGLYLKFEVPLVLAAVPEDKTIFAFYGDGRIHVYRAGDVLDGGDVLPGFSVPVDDLFL
jgi:Uma2 family endonuclease